MSEKKTPSNAVRIAEMFEDFAIDHTPDGWPAVKQMHLTAAAAELRQCDALISEMVTALVTAREFISCDRNAFADCAISPDGFCNIDDASALADYDAALLQINAAILKAQGAA